MPYIEIKAYSKDEATKKKVAEEIKKVFLENWGCPESAITVGIKEYTPDEWQKEVREGDIERDMSRVYILEGKDLK